MGGLVALAGGCRHAGVEQATVVIRNVTVIDGTDAGPRANLSVAIQDDRIVAVGPADEIPAAGTAATIDGTGKFLIPGLADLHVHLMGYGEHALPLFLANGVTTIRDMGGSFRLAGWARQEVHYGRLIGPEVLVSGPRLSAPAAARAGSEVLGRDGMVAVGDSADAVRVVDSLASLHVDQLSIGPLLSAAAYHATIREAERRGLPVVGPIPDALTASAVIEAGQWTIESDLGLALEGSSQADRLDSLLRVRVAAALARGRGRRAIATAAALRREIADSARRSYDLNRANEFARQAARTRVWFDPTLALIEAGLRRHEGAIRYPPELQYAPWAARELAGDFPVEATPGDVGSGKERFRAVLTTFAALVSAKARFVAGSGTPAPPLVPGFSLHHELELLVEMGLTPLQALQAATRNAAEATGRLDQVGTIERGRRADLVLLDADPLVDIRNTRRVNTVIVAGRLLDRATLDRMLADARVYAEQR